jgi:hypothetical protein
MVERKRFKPKPEKPQTYAGAKRGPKSTYLPIYAKMAEALCARGATDADLASAFGKTTMTIHAWCSEHPEFGQAILHGKAAVFDPKVERALAQRALGYSVDTEEIKVIDGQVVRVPIRKHFPPDTTACIFWLKNRHPEAWRDVHRVEHGGELKVENLTSEQLLEQIRKDATELGILSEAALHSGVAPNGKGNGTKH